MYYWHPLTRIALPPHTSGDELQTMTPCQSHVESPLQRLDIAQPPRRRSSRLTAKASIVGTTRTFRSVRLSTCNENSLSPSEFSQTQSPREVKASFPAGQVTQPVPSTEYQAVEPDRLDGSEDYDVRRWRDNRSGPRIGPGRTPGNRNKR